MVSVLHFSDRFSTEYTHLLQKSLNFTFLKFEFSLSLKHFVIFFWVAAGFGCIYPSNQLNGALDQDMVPPTNSQAATAKALYTEKFSSAANSAVFVVFSRSTNSTPLLPSTILPNRTDFSTFDLLLNQTLLHYGVEDCYNKSNCTKVPSPVLSYSSFLSVIGVNLPGPVALQYMSAGNLSAIGGIAFKYGYYTEETKQFEAFLKNATTTLAKVYLQDVDVEILGLTTVNEAVAAAATDDTTILLVVIPVGYFIFAWHLSSLRFLIFPIAMTFFSLTTTFAIMYGVAGHMHLNSLMPGIVLCLVLCLVINYSILVLSTYKQEVRNRLRLTQHLKKEHVQDVVRIVLAKAGYHVTISGIALAVSCGGLAVFPLVMIQSIGIGCLVGVLVTLLQCFTFIPAMLLACPRFFTFAVRPCCEDGPTNRISFSRLSLGFYDENEPLPLLQPNRKIDRKTWYFKLGLSVETPPLNYIVVIFIFVCCIYPAIKAFDTKYSNEAQLYIPRQSNQLTAWTNLYKDFGPGELYTYNLVLVANYKDMVDDKNWRAVQAIVTELTLLPNTRCENLNTASFDGVQGCLNKTKNDILGGLFICGQYPWDPKKCTPSVKYAAVLGSIFLRPYPQKNDATYIMIKLKIDPLSDEGKTWYNDVKELMAQIPSKYNMTAGLTGFGADSIDSIDFVTQNFKFMVVITSCVIFVFVAFAFVSIVVPLRVLITTTTTIMVVYGLASLVYIDGKLDFLNFDGLRKTGSLSWMAPFSAFMICVGLSLDYDTYLVTKILEYVLLKKEPCDAIVMGLSDSGKTLTVSGLIISLCFGGLLFSDIPVMNQIAFYIIATALVDTFLIRLVLAPALMGILGVWNWFPMFHVFNDDDRAIMRMSLALPAPTLEAERQAGFFGGDAGDSLLSGGKGEKAVGYDTVAKS